MDAAEYLVEIDAHNGTSVVTLRYSTTGYRTGPSDTPANTLYDAVVKDPGNISRALFGDKKTMGAGQTSYGEIVLTNANGALDALIAYGFDGRKVVVKRLSSARAAFSSATTVLRGTGERLDSDDALREIRLRLYDRRLELDQPVQTNRYGGTTTSGGIAGHLADGTADMKDQTKPLVFGAVFNIQPAPVNPFDLIFQVSDSAVKSITVCDGQVPLVSAGDFGTVALLQAAHIPPGKSGTCLASGLFRIGCATYFQLTADVVEGTNLTDRCASAVVQRIMGVMGLSGSTNIDATSFGTFASAAPQEVGIYIADDTHGTVAIGQVISGVGGYMIPMATGPWQAGVAPVIGTPAWAIDKTLAGDSIAIISNPDTDHGVPVYRILLNYGESYTVQTANDVCPGATAARKGFAAVAVRQSKVEDVSVRTQFLLAAELDIDTLMTTAADAATEATRRFALYSVERTVLDVTVPQSAADAMTLGSTGTLTMARYGCDSGKNFVVLERAEDWANEKITLTLWG